MELQVIEAAGGHYEIGFAVGAAAGQKIKAAIASYRIILPREGWSGPWQLPEEYLAAAEAVSPDLVEELRGMAEGAAVSFNDLFFLNALEEALEIQEPRRCSCIGLNVPGGCFLAHNEDWYAEDAAHIIVILARPRGKPAFISVTAAHFLATIGVNEAGIAQGVNSVASLDSRAGVPRMFAARAVLEATDLEEAVAIALPNGRAGGYNHMLVSRGGRMGNLETAACSHAFAPEDPVIYHTNHYVIPAMQAQEKGASQHSLKRYTRLGELAESLPHAADPCRALAEALQDHYNRPYSICKHAPEQESGDGTIFTAIFDTDRFSALVAAGNPCRGRFQQITFNGVKS